MKTNSLLKTVFSILFLLLLSGCHFNSTSINREEDKNDAERVTKKFYTFLENKNYNGLHKLISKGFWKITDEAKLDGFLEETDDKLGAIKSKKLDHWETKIVKGTNPSSTYVLYYLVQREKFEAMETVTLTEENDQVKIYGYHVNSEGWSK